jgi:general secretion pathway protein D
MFRIISSARVAGLAVAVSGCMFAASALGQTAAAPVPAVVPSAAPSVPATAQPVTTLAVSPAAPPAAETPAIAVRSRLAPAPSKHDLKLAERDYRRGRKLFKKGDLDAAESAYAEAARLAPANEIYVAERELTRTKLVSDLLATAETARQSGDHAAATGAIERAHDLDPTNTAVDEQVRAEATAEQPAVLPSSDLAKVETGVIQLQPTGLKAPIHFRGGGQELVRQVFQHYGIMVSLDESVPNQTVRIDTDDLDFSAAQRMVLLMTDSFCVPLDAHRALIAKDSRQNREKFERQYVETVYMPGLTHEELQDASSVVKQIFQVRQTTTNAENGSITLRAPQATLQAANAVLTDLYQGNSQVLIKLTLYQITQTRERVVGIQLPSALTIYNIPAELASLYLQYASLIQQLIASGLVNANNPLEIIAALIASGELTSGPFTEGFVRFGGGLTGFAATIGSGSTLNADLNSSNTRQLDQVQLRVGNKETATFRSGTRYPIITASYSSVGVSSAALGTAGANIMQLLQQNGLSGALAATPTIPSVQYEDLGLTIKATPTIQKSGDVSMKLELKLSALAGGSLNNVPILANREFQTTIGVKEGEASIITSLLSRQESKALTGIPGLNDIPGFPATNVDHTVDTSELVMVLEPHVVRLDHPNGESKMIILPRH